MNNTSQLPILIVEDDTFLREMYVHVFAKDGFSMIQAEDGEQGIEVAESTNVQLILLDIMLPKKTGIDVLRQLRLPDSRAINTPIILLTNLGQESIIREAFKIGANGYILKADLLPHQVLDKVKQFLAGKLTQEDFLSTQSLD